MTLLFFLYALHFIGYGLPLHLVGDEESLVGGALKMLELRTIAPVLHRSEFAILYYPTLLSYLYIILWTPYLIATYLFSHYGASVSEFTPYVLTHLDDLWMLSRIASVIAGSALIFVLCDIAHTLFPRDNRVALFSSGLLGLSLLHFQLSVVSGHWIFDTLFFFTVVSLLLRNKFRDTRSALLGGIVAGLGFGLSSMGFVSLFFVIMLYLLMNVRERWLGLANSRFWYFICSALLLAIGFIVLHPDAYSYVIAGKDTAGLAVKDLGFVWNEILTSAYYLFSNDFMISALSIIGLGLLVFYGFARYALTSIVMFVVYELLLVFFFHNAARYHVFLIPMQALVAGYGLAVVYEHSTKRGMTRYLAYAFVAIAFLVPATVLARYSALLLTPTTEQKAARWVSEQEPQEYVIVDSPTIVFFQSDEAVAEQQKRGRVSAIARRLQSVDITRFGAQKLDYTNLHFWDPANLTRGSVEEFVRSFRPRYYIVSYDNKVVEMTEVHRYLINHGRLVRSFLSTDGTSKLDVAIEPTGDLGLSAQKLFQIRRLGQNVDIYELTYQENG